MTTPMTTEELDRIEARANEAENGWSVVRDADDPYRYEIHGDGPTRVAVFGGDSDDSMASYPTEENARFAAHARSDVPVLAHEIRRLNATLTRVRAAVTSVRGDHDFDVSEWGQGVRFALNAIETALDWDGAE